MKKTAILLSLASSFLISGCVTSRRQSSVDSKQLQVMRQQLVRSQETTKYYEEQIGKIFSELANIQDDYSGLVAKINAQNNTISVLNKNNKTLEGQIKDLRKLLVAEQKSRQSAINQMIEQVSKQTASAINLAKEAKAQVAAKISSSSSSSGTGSPVGPGQFYEHRVESGHTLSAIAAAYKVTVSDIKKANRLKSDVIRVGQILYIPKKK